MLILLKMFRIVIKTDHDQDHQRCNDVDPVPELRPIAEEPISFEASVLIDQEVCRHDVEYDRHCEMCHVVPTCLMRVECVLETWIEDDHDVEDVCEEIEQVRKEKLTHDVLPGEFPSEGN